jgi:hypothetical protein
MAVTNNFRSVRLIGRTGQTLDRITGTRGEIYYDTTANSLRLYDSEERGGATLATQDWALEEIQKAPSALPGQTGNSGKVLSTNGTSANWLSIVAGTNISISPGTGTLTINSTFNSISQDPSPVLGGNLNTLNNATQYRIVNLPDPLVDTEPVTKGYLEFQLSNFGTGGAVGAGALIGTTLAANVVNSSLTSVGTLASVTVTGNTVLNSNLTVNGTTTEATEYFRITNGAISPLVKFSVDSSNGNTDIQGTLSVLGNTSFTGNITSVTDITASGELTVVDISSSGSITTGNISSNAIVTTGSVIVANGVTIQTNRDISNIRNIATTGNITSGGAVSVSGNVTSTTGAISGQSAEFTNNVLVGGNVSISTTPTQQSHAANKKYVDTKSIALSIALS